MVAHVFVDETKQRGYQLVAAHTGAADLTDDLRQLVRGLVLKGQRRVHMTKESDPRKRVIVAAICGSAITATVYDACRRYSHELDARAACLGALIDDLARGGATRLLIEQDDSLLRWDLQRLIELTRTANCGDSLRYEHQRGQAELLLAIPDAIAWCWAKGGDWRRPIEPIVTDVRRV
ncbi:hypothetical protein [Sporichthya sp.]|uniref:hypothetical protein n=1 Tax=Sporichthya sp. TaxID=65475 RepID=UPI0017B7CC57|nr:hypothetical protein [Sporichthya sp.]MBA3741627.1 hypothetical protein [Sporichthya sp.]